MFAVSETTFKVLYDPPFIWRIFFVFKRNFDAAGALLSEITIRYHIFSI
jgi:hypothetical protein